MDAEAKTIANEGVSSRRLTGSLVATLGHTINKNRHEANTSCLS